MFDRVLYN